MAKKDNAAETRVHGISSPLVKLANVCALFIPFALVWFFYYEQRTRTANSRQSTVLFLGALIFVLFYLLKKMDALKYSRFRISELIFSQVIAVAATDVVAALGIWMLSVHFPNLLPGLACFFAQCGISVLCVILARNIYFYRHAPEPTVIIYGDRPGLEDLVNVYGLEKRFAVQGIFGIEEAKKAPSAIAAAKTLFLFGVPSHDRNVFLKQGVEKGQDVFVIPRIGDAVMSSAERMHMFHLPMLRVKRYMPATEYRIIKRAFDMLVSGIALILLSPVLLCVALMVRTDGGPVFYKQVRLTKDGKEFKILKFRSMCVDAEKYSGAVLSSGENDPRITKVGRILRAYRLDEIPQLWNIFVGDMSIVGPRPERPEIAAEYEKEIPEFRLRLQAKAGLTGYAQVYGKYNTEPYDKLLMDLMYIAKPSVLEDIAIMLATVKILFSRESTEGVAEGQTTAMDYGNSAESTENDSEMVKK